MRYWMLPNETLYSSLDFMSFCLESRNKETVKEACDEFGGEITDLQGILLLAQSEEASKLALAARHCELSVVKHLCEVQRLKVTKEATIGAIQANNVTCLQYFKATFSTGYDYECVAAAASGGHVDCLEIILNSKEHLHCNEFFLSKAWTLAARAGQIITLQALMKLQPVLSFHDNCDALRGAAMEGQLSCIEFLCEALPSRFHANAVGEGALRGGQLEVLQYAVAKGADITTAYDWIVKVETAGHLACVEYLYAAGVTAHAEDIYRLAKNGSVDFMRFMLDHGFIASQHLSQELAQTGNIEVLKFLRSRGCSWDATTCEAAARTGQLQCLKFLHENDCPWDKGTCASSVYRGHLNCLQYAHDNGCPWDTQRIALIAAKAFNSYCLKYVVENGASLSCEIMLHTVHNAFVTLEIVQILLSYNCPCDARATTAAASRNSLDMLVLLHNSGCPWDGSVLIKSARRNHLKCVQYAHKHGCHWPEPEHLDYVSADCRSYMKKHGCPGL